MSKTGSQAWSLGLDDVMQQINDSPHASLPTGITPNIVVFNRKRKAETRDPPRQRGIIMTISEGAIDHICSTNEPDINAPDVGAFEVALESNIQEILIGTDESGNYQGLHQISPNTDIPPAHTQNPQKSLNLPESPKSSPLSIASSRPSSTPSSPPPAASSKGKEGAIESTSSEE